VQHQIVPPPGPGVNSGCARGAPAHLGYEFDPIPRQAVDLVAAHVLQPIDVEVLALLLRYRSRLRTSCWTTIGRLSVELDRSESTIRRSLHRLKAAGLIRHVQVAERGEPDPDEPRNRTGWRFYFAWMESAPTPSAVPPTPCQPSHPLPVSCDTQGETKGNPLPKGNQDDEDAARSSSSDSSPPEKTGEAISKAVEAASVLVTKPAAAVGRILKDHPAITPGDVVEAVAIARDKGRGWSYAIGVIENWAVEGRALPPAPKPKPARTYHRAEPPTAESIAAGAEAAATWRRIRAQAAAEG
jgi:hypothetical protein